MSTPSGDHGSDGHERGLPWPVLVGYALTVALMTVGMFVTVQILF